MCSYVEDKRLHKKATLILEFFYAFLMKGKIYKMNEEKKIVGILYFK